MSLNSIASGATSTDDQNGSRLVAVIDIGSVSVRMQIAEIHQDGRIRNLDSFIQAVSLGKESFKRGFIPSDSIEECVEVLIGYRKLLVQFGITAAEQIRVVATSAVKSSSNRMAFIDRIYIATGFEIEPFEEAELHRAIYFAMTPIIESHEPHFCGESLVLEVGGGTTELLLLDDANVSFSQTFSLGALRLRNTFDQLEVNADQARRMMESEIIRVAKQIKSNHPFQQCRRMIGIGGDLRLAARKIIESPILDPLSHLNLKKFESFSNQVLAESPEQLATRFRTSLIDAQTLGPALLIYQVLMRELSIDQFLIANVNLRDGLVKEMAEGRIWTKAIQNQIVKSAMLTGRKFHFDELHSLHIADLACQLFDQLQSLHELSDRFRGILQIAALLYDIGSFISAQSRHKHSQYLIQNSDLFGVGKADLELISLVARYHRRAFPQPGHLAFSNLPREKRVVVAKLAALLRIAKALDISFSRRVESFRCIVHPKWVTIAVENLADVSLERLEVRSASGLFEQIFGKRIQLETTSEN